MNGLVFADSAVGLQSFLEKRAQEEVKIAFLYRLRNADSIRRYFPKTYNALSTMDIVNRFGLTNRVKVSADSDFRNLHCIILKDIIQTKEDKEIDKLCAARIFEPDSTKFGDSLRKQVEDRLTFIGAYLERTNNKSCLRKPNPQKSDCRNLFTALVEKYHEKILKTSENQAVFKLFLATLQNRIKSRRRTLPQILTSVELKQLETDLQAQADVLLAELKDQLLKSSLVAQEIKNERYFKTALDIEEFIDTVHEALERFSLAEPDIFSMADKIDLKAYCDKVNWCGEDNAELAKIFNQIEREFRRRRPDFLAVVQFNIDLFNLAKNLSANDPDLYNDFILLANLAMAKNFEEFEAILEKAALPVGSYRQKRKGSFGIFLNGYAGLGYSPAYWGEGNYVRIAMPVGFEFSKGSVLGGSIGIFLSVFNLGYPLMDAANRADTITWANSVAPGAFAVFGIPHVPVSFAAGIEYLEKNGAHREFYFSLYLAVDVPIFDVYLR